jgi:hypothetical protein
MLATLLFILSGTTIALYRAVYTTLQVKLYIYAGKIKRALQSSLKEA